MYGQGYLFVYDEMLNERRFERELANVETHLTSLGINGQVIRLAMYRGVKEVVEQAIKRGVTHIVMFGKDETLDKVMWFLPDMDVYLGYVPFGPSKIGQALGIPSGPGACDILAARFVETIDLGICEGRYFLTEARMSQVNAHMKIDSFELAPQHSGTMIVRNLQTDRFDRLMSDAKDGYLDVIIQPDAQTTSRWRKVEMPETRIRIKEGALVSKDPVDLHVDEHVVNGFHFTFTIAPKKLRMIVGRQRHVSPIDPVLPNVA